MNNESHFIPNHTVGKSVLFYDDAKSLSYVVSLIDKRTHSVANMSLFIAVFSFELHNMFHVFNY